MANQPRLSRTGRPVHQAQPISPPSTDVFPFPQVLEN